MADLISLRDCPPGLFRFGETIGFKTEYRGMQTVGPIDIPGDQVRWVVGDHSDVYVVETGESFWAGAANRAARDAMLVEPIEFEPARLASVSSASAEGASGMKTWLGGDAAPADWDGGRVLFRHGGTSTSRPGEGMCWSHGMLGGGKTDIIAYTPKSEPVPATNQAGEVERLSKALFEADPDVGCPWEEWVAYAEAHPDHLQSVDFVRRQARAVAALATQPATSQEGENGFEALHQAVRSIGAATPTPPTLSAQEGEAVATAKARLSIATVKARNRGAERGTVEVIADDVAVLIAAHSDLDRQFSALATEPATSQEGEGQHPDDRAVDVFAAAMKTKLAKAREKGRGGWDDPAQCSVAYLQQLLQEHIVKGDPVDVANFCMMLAHYGAPTTQRPAPIKCEHCRDTGFYDYAHFSIDPCNHCGDALAATPTPPTLSEDLRGVDLGPPDELGSAAFELLALGYAKATAWHKYGIAWDHLERISQNELIETARAALAQVKAS